MKLLVIGVLVLFVGFWMVQAPDSLATFTQDSATWVWDLTQTVFSSVIDYLDSVFS